MNFEKRLEKGNMISKQIEKNYFKKYLIKRKGKKIVMQRRRGYE